MTESLTRQNYIYPDYQALVSAIESEEFKPRVVQAMSRFDRINFLPEIEKQNAYLDTPLPLLESNESTNSQPSVVLWMLNELSPQPGNLVLEIGTGSCWVAAILSDLVGSEGQVIGTEANSEVFYQGVNNLGKLGGFGPKGFKNLTLINTASLPPFVETSVADIRYDRILVSADISQDSNYSYADLRINPIYLTLLKSLNDGGILVVPFGNSVWTIQKTVTKITAYEYLGFKFVAFKK